MITGTNDGSMADGWLKDRIKDADLGPGGRVVIFDAIPKDLETWLKRDAKRRRYHLHFGGGGYRAYIETKAQIDKSDADARELARAEDERINSPG